LLSALRRPEVRDFGPLVVVLAMTGAFFIYRVSGGDLGLTPAGEWRRQPAGLAAAILVALALTARGRAWAVATRLLAPLGTISYGIYLYHWVVLRELVDRGLYPLPVPGWLTLPAKIAVALALVIPLAALSYVLVERPAMRAASAYAARGRRRVGIPAEAVA
jgi:peptidoglycan/LPS O-acetylase OafA/YrhL